jgi:REP element-mobilizing transposase RayT
MARPLRIEFPGAVYHVTGRGNQQRTTFEDDADRGLFLAVLARSVDRFDLTLHAYCLMGNHYHLLVETPSAGLGRAMRDVNGVYTQAFNSRHRTVGHLFQGRYKAILVERDAHMLELARYVVLNPVRAGLCKSPDEYRWSSYRATAGLEPVPPLLTVDWLLAQLAGRPARARERYRAFVADGLGVDPFADLRGVVLGDDEFVAETTAKRSATGEAPRGERRPLRPSLAELFDRDGERAILSAYREHGYRLAEIAAHMGCHSATVSRRLRLLEADAELPPRRRRA